MRICDSTQDTEKCPLSVLNGLILGVTKTKTLEN